MLRAPRPLATLAGLAALGLAFAVLHGALAQSSRFVPDDLCLFGSVRRLGVLGTQRVLYTTWSGRWASNLLVTVVLSRMSDARAAAPYALVLLGFVAAAVWLAIGMLLRARLVAGAKPLLALATVALLFFATPERGDSWFFVFCSLENLVPLCCALLALACVLRAGARRGLVVPGALLAAVATGGHESVALPVLALGASALLVALLRDRADPRARPGMVVLGVAAASFAVSAASPGSSARLGTLEPMPWSTALWSAATRGPDVVLDVARASLPVLAATLLVWAAAASVLATGPEARRGSSARVLALLAVLVAAGWLVALVATLPGFYALDEPPPLRAQLVLAFFLVAAGAWLGAAAGGVLGRSPVGATVIVGAMLCAVAVVLAGETPRMLADVRTARAYARAYDARMATLREVRGFTGRGRGPILLDPLPPSGVLRTAEISADDPGAYANRCLKRMMRTGRPVLRRPGAALSP